MIPTILLLIVAVNDINCAFVKGVSKKMQKRYQPVSGKFKCLDKSQEFPYEYLNDDYCDCADGSDEPGTHACPYGYFWCQNLGYREARISVMDVNDKICNCCDGSDEEVGLCKNSCHILAAQEREKHLKVVKMLTDAKSKISEVKQIFEERGKNIKAAMPDINKKIGQYSEKISSLENLQLEKKAELSDVKNQYIIAWSNILKTNTSKKIFTALDTNSDQFLDETEYSNYGLDKIFNTEKIYNFLKFPISEEDFIKIWVDNFPSIISFDQNLSDSSETNENDKFQTSSIDNSLKIDSIEENSEETEYGEDGLPILKQQIDLTKSENHIPDPKNKDVNIIKNIYQEYISKLQSPVNDQINEIENKIKDFDYSIENLHNSIKNMTKYFSFLEMYNSLDFGPERAYSMLFDICLRFEQPPFIYNICPFFQGTQERNGKFLSIGRWVSWKNNNNYSQMVYDDGDECYNNIKRSFEINLSCGSENLIKSVVENEVCKYVVELETPASCVHVEIPIIHDEL